MTSKCSFKSPMESGSFCGAQFTVQGSLGARCPGSTLLGLRIHHTCIAGARPKDLPVGASHLSSRPGHHCPYNGPSSVFQSHVSLICPQISPQDCSLSIPTPGYPLPIYVLLNTLSCTERAGVFTAWPACLRPAGSAPQKRQNQSGWFFSPLTQHVPSNGTSSELPA